MAFLRVGQRVQHAQLSIPAAFPISIYHHRPAARLLFSCQILLSPAPSRTLSAQCSLAICSRSAPTGMAHWRLLDRFLRTSVPLISIRSRHTGSWSKTCPKVLRDQTHPVPLRSSGNDTATIQANHIDAFSHTKGKDTSRSFFANRDWFHGNACAPRQGKEHHTSPQEN